MSRRLRVGTLEFNFRSEQLTVHGCYAELYGVVSGTTISAAHAQSFWDRIDRADWLVVARMVRDAMVLGSEYAANYRINDLDGAVRHIVSQSWTRRDKNGKPEINTVAAVDMTELAQFTLDPESPHDKVVDGLLYARDHALTIDRPSLTYILDIGLLDLAHTERAQARARRRH